MSLSPAHLDESAIHPLLGQLFGAWNSGEIRWCFLRRPADLARPSGDLDLLIGADDLATVITSAVGHGFARLPGDRGGTHLITYHRETDLWLWLHCVTEVALGPFFALKADPTAALLSRRSPGGLPRLAPDDEFWITLAHCLLERHRVAERHRHRLPGLALHATLANSLAQGLGRLLPSGQTLEGVVDAVRRGDWNALEGLVPSLVERCIRMRPPLSRRVAPFFRRLPGRLRAARLSRGMSVALLGPDGAGKSTLAAGLEREFVFPVRTVYMGLTGGMLARVDRLRIPGVVRLGRLLVIWGRYLRAQHHILRGRLVVFDRYVYDAEVPTPYPLRRSRRLGRWIDGRSCPPPDLVIVLDAPGQVMHQRKGAYDAETLENWRQHFRALLRRIPGLVIVDTTQGVDAVRADVTARVWQRYVKRWSAT
jgi:thymidylate kinase